jgi:16S rRNA (uracil1498-N3)-methyltransferase
MQLFYTQNIHNNILQLEDEEFHHLKVLRKKQGDELVVTNGEGALYKAVITDLAKHHCNLEIIHTEQTKPQSHQLHVAVAPTKNADRIEWLVEKLVEIGVGEISFIQCKHSERKVQKTERLKKIALSAMKQSLKYYLPKINELVAFDAFMGLPHTNSNLFIGYCETPATVFLPAQTFTHANTVVLIGPEGDFSADEVAKAQKAGYVPVSLGGSRLRTETAAMVAATLINAKFETQ